MIGGLSIIDPELGVWVKLELQIGLKALLWMALELQSMGLYPYFEGQSTSKVRVESHFWGPISLKLGLFLGFWGLFDWFWVIFSQKWVKISQKDPFLALFWNSLILGLRAKFGRFQKLDYWSEYWVQVQFYLTKTSSVLKLAFSLNPDLPVAFGCKCVKRSNTCLSVCHQCGTSNFMLAHQCVHDSV